MVRSDIWLPNSYCYMFHYYDDEDIFLFIFLFFYFLPFSWCVHVVFLGMFSYANFFFFFSRRFFLWRIFWRFLIISVSDVKNVTENLSEGWNVVSECRLYICRGKCFQQKEKQPNILLDFQWIDVYLLKGTTSKYDYNLLLFWMDLCRFCSNI